MAAYVRPRLRLVPQPWRSRAMQVLLALLFLTSPIVFVPAALREEETDLWVRAGVSRSVVKEVLLPVSKSEYGPAAPSDTPSFCYALVSGQGLFRATVSPQETAAAEKGTTIWGGAIWRPIDSDLPSKQWRNIQVQALAVDPSNPAVLYAGMGGTGSRNPAQSAGLYATSDGGQTWQTPVKSIAGQEVQAIAVMPHGQDRTAVAPASGAVSFPNPEEGVSATRSGARSAYSVACAATSGGIYCNTGENQSWVRLDWRGIETRVLSLAIRPDNPGAIYVGTDGFGLEVTTDGGATWRQGSTDLRNRYVYDMVISDSRPEMMYVATDGGVFESTDAGSTWILLDGPTKGRRVNAIALQDGTVASGEAGTVLYVGLQYGAAYRYSPTSGEIVADGDNKEDGDRLWSDSSGNWVPLKRGLGNLTILSLALDPNDPTVLWAGTTDGVWRCALSSLQQTR